MGRISLIIAAIGIIAAREAYQELSLASGTTEEPLHIELEDLEAGSVPENNHLRIGEHWQVFEGAVYEYEGGYQDGEPDPSTAVNYLYYPIVSTASKDIQGDTVRSFTVLVRSRKYETVGAIPQDDMRLDASLRGLVVNAIEPVTADEYLLLRESYPGINLESLVIVEQGRRPPSMTGSALVLAGGVIAILMGATGVYRNRDEEV